MVRQSSSREQLVTVSGTSSSREQLVAESEMVKEESWSPRIQQRSSVAGVVDICEAARTFVVCRATTFCERILC